METQFLNCRMVIYVSDIQRQSGCVYNTAKEMMDGFLKDLGKAGKWLSVREYCDATGLQYEEVIKEIFLFDESLKRIQAAKKASSKK